MAKHVYMLRTRKRVVSQTWYPSLKQTTLSRFISTAKTVLRDVQTQSDVCLFTVLTSSADKPPVAAMVTLRYHYHHAQN